MKIAILGAGALGCLYGAYLSKEHDVTFVVRRGEQMDAINDKGITCESPDGDFIVKAKACTEVSDVPVQDVVFVFVKGYDTESALNGIRTIIGPDTIVCSLQNGLGNYENMVRVVPKEQIILGTSNRGAYIICDGHVVYAGGTLDHIGSPTGDVSKAKVIADIISNAGFVSELNDEIEYYIWQKLFVNIGVNAITGILEYKNAICKDNENGRRLSELAIREAVKIAVSTGLKFDEDETVELFFNCLVTGNNSSMFQDISKKRPTEIDTINGAVVRLAKEKGLSAPVNETLTLLVKAKTDILTQ